MEFHISRAARNRYQVDETLFDYVGNVVFGDVVAARKLAAKMTEVRQSVNRKADVVNAGALFAMGLIDELSHAMVAKYRKTIDPQVLPAALQWFVSNASKADVDRLMGTFIEQFPNVSIYRGEETIAEWLAREVDGLPNREAAVEELLLLWLANINPAYKPFRELFDDRRLVEGTVYKRVTAKLGDYFATRPPFSAKDGTLLDVLKAPMLASPDSLSGQLDYIREHWVEYIGDELRSVLLAIDVLREEDVAIWMRFHPADGMGHADWRQDGAVDYGMQGFSGDEYLGFADLQLEEERQRALEKADQLNEYEAFSQDQAWMPTVVLIAKSTYVWLEQLSKKYQRHIHRLDQIPQEEMHVLAGRGLNGLWLIGLWERSVASQTIKRMRGQADAVASAYSLRDYRIAEDLGGQPAYEVLRERAARAGIRLASDMVPNHMGIDSTWVLEHPDWFISRPESPFPVYRFEGPDLSIDPNVEIKIEDHYFDQTDAAVVFRLRNRGSGKTDFVFHGNDGTTFAWNDTAQLDYSKAHVREQVIQTILEVAKLFPIIRFDAAMVLAKKHVQRLWFPLPGEGRSIPSRAENAMSQEEFDALMPHEFWREVVDRVAVEVPGTLLLAEAFWLLEGYFVRTLGMHRVYNSAFMNMLRDEENAKYRSYLKKTIEFDPDILKRYVNFMSNPDERTAIDQFGTGDKYFGCCTLMATLPGLPMFGHGQIEAFTERYGMEYKKARFDEYPNDDLIARHQREIMPLLKDRSLFAESSYFRMYDFNTPDGHVDENVFAFSNREHDRKAVILFNNRYESTRGTIHWSVEQVNKGAGVMEGQTLGDAIELPWDDGAMLAYKDSATGLEYLRWSQDLRSNGITVDLRGYQYMVLLNWKERRASDAYPWDRLCNALNGAGVASLDEALSKLRLMPVHDALRHLLEPGTIQMLIATSSDEAQAKITGASGVASAASLKTEEIEELALGEEPPTEGLKVPAVASPSSGVVEKAKAFYAAAGQIGELPDGFTGDGLTASLEAAARIPGVAIAETEIGHVLPIGQRSRLSVALWAPVLAWSVVKELVPEGASGQSCVETFDRLQLRAALAENFVSLGFEHESSWRAAARVRTLLAYGAPVEDEAADFLGLPEGFWSEPDVRWLAGVNETNGKAWFNKELLEDLLWWMTLPTLTAEPPIDSVGIQGLHQKLGEARAAATRAGFEVERFVPKPKAAVSVTLEAEPLVVDPEETDVEIEDASELEDPVGNLRD